MFFFALDICKGGRRRGQRGTFRVFENGFFIVGRLGVIFLTNSLWEGGKGASGERVQVDYFLFLFFLLSGRGVEVNVFFFPRYMKR
jgi:hypothetical protein